MSTRITDSVSKASSNNLNRQVAQYSIAAAVAGVSMLALAAPAAGEVVVTKKTIQVPIATSDMPHPARISMANNGVNNFSFNLVSFPPNGTTYPIRDLFLDGASSNANPLVGIFSLNPYAAVLPRGAKIGPSSGSVAFAGPFAMLEVTYAGPALRALRGYWGGSPKDRYVGVRFQINGQTHYGWIRLTVTTSTDPHGPLMSATITGYAYETVASKPILAGTAGTRSAADKPSAEVQAPKNVQTQIGPSLGMLAAGADALPVWRREGIPVR